MQKDTYKKLLWIFLLAFLILPVFQQYLHLVYERPLKGAIDQYAPGAFSFTNWFSGKFQQDEETYVTAGYGFHNTIVRLNNQIDYSLFGKVHARSVVVGKNNYLFEDGYIRAYYGEDFKGSDNIKPVIKKIKLVQDSLAAINKYLLIVIAPSKAHFYPEYIPDHFTAGNDSNNYEAFISLAQKTGIRYIDFNSYFMSQKKSAAYPLFPRNGTHWTLYGACLAQDSLVNYFNHSFKFDLPEFHWDKIEMDTARDSDNDIGAALNLVIPLKSETLAYPKLRLYSDTEWRRPKFLVIADSYYWTLYGLGFPGLFTNAQFWFYNREVWPESEKTTVYSNQISIREVLTEKELIILMCNPISLDQIGWGFLDDASRIFQHSYDEEMERKMDEVRKQILNNPDWLKSVTEKALSNNVSLDSQLVNDVLWILNNR